MIQLPIEVIIASGSGGNLLKTCNSTFSLTSAERETLILFCDDDRDKIFIYTSQQRMIRKLLKNPLFDCKNMEYNDLYNCYPNPVSIEGVLPFNALTFRSKTIKLSESEKKKRRKRLKLAREDYKLRCITKNSDLIKN